MSSLELRLVRHSATMAKAPGLLLTFHPQRASAADRVTENNHAVTEVGLLADRLLLSVEVHEHLLSPPVGRSARLGTRHPSLI